MSDNLSERDIFEAAGPGGTALPEPAEPSTGETVRAEEERPTANLGQLPDEGDQGREQAAEGEQEPEPNNRSQRGILEDLREQRKAAKELQKSLAERDRQLSEMTGAIRAMQAAQAQQANRQQAQPQAQPDQQPEPAPDPFVDPEGHAAWVARREMQRHLAPYFQQQQARERQLQQHIQGLQRQTAAAQYGEEVAREAELAFNTAAARGEIDRADWERINGSPNPWAAAVQWHRRETNLKLVGNDPNKWMETEVQRRLREDPQFAAQIMSSLQGQAQQASAGNGQSVPAGARPAPLFTGLPPSLNAAPGTSGQQSSGPISEADIFAAAPPRMGGRR